MLEIAGTFFELPEGLTATVAEKTATVLIMFEVVRKENAIKEQEA